MSFVSWESLGDEEKIPGKSRSLGLICNPAGNEPVVQDGPDRHTRPSPVSSFWVSTVPIPTIETTLSHSHYLGERKLERSPLFTVSDVFPVVYPSLLLDLCDSNKS